MPDAEQEFCKGWSNKLKFRVQPAPYLHQLSHDVYDYNQHYSSSYFTGGCCTPAKPIVAIAAGEQRLIRKPIENKDYFYVGSSDFSPIV